MGISVVSLRCHRAVLRMGFALPLVWVCFTVALAEQISIEIRGSLTAMDGVYRPTSDLVNGQVAYTKNSGELWICRDTNGFWNVQPTAQKGTADGFMISAEVGKAGPEDALTWRIWTDGAWKQVASVTVGIAALEIKVSTTAAAKAVVQTEVVSTSAVSTPATTPQGTAPQAPPAHTVPQAPPAPTVPQAPPAPAAASTPAASSQATNEPPPMPMAHTVPQAPPAPAVPQASPAPAAASTPAASSQATTEPPPMPMQTSTFVPVGGTTFAEHRSQEGSRIAIRGLVVAGPQRPVQDEPATHQQQQVQNSELAKTYLGSFTTGYATRPMKLKLVSSKKALLAEAGTEHTVSIEQTGDQLQLKDMGLAFILEGSVKDSNIIGNVLVNSKEVGSFKLTPSDKPLGSFVPTPLGRRFFMVACACIVAMVFIYSWATRHSYVYVRMYMHKVVGSALTLIVGMLIAQCMAGCLVSIPEHIPNFGEEAAVLLLLFTLAWFCVTHMGGMFQKNPGKRTILTMLGSDILGFLGFYAFEALWKYLASLSASKFPGAVGSIGTAVATLALSVVFLFVLTHITEHRRTNMQTEQVHEIQNRQMHIQKRDEQATAAAGQRACAQPLTGRVCGMGWKPSAPKPEAPADTGLKPQTEWHCDVMQVENFAICITVAFITFKIVKLVAHIEHAWWGMALANGIVLLMVVHAVNMKDDRGVSRFERIYTATLALLLGLCTVDLVNCVIKKATGTMYMIAPMVTVLVVFIMALVIIQRIGQYLHMQFPEQEGDQMPGILTATPQDSFAAKEPQEIAGLGLMIAVAAVNVIDMALVEIVDNFSVTHRFPLITKVLFAALIAMFTVWFWQTQVLPKVSKTRKQHEEEFNMSVQQMRNLKADEEEPLTRLQA